MNKRLFIVVLPLVAAIVFCSYMLSLATSSVTPSDDELVYPASWDPGYKELEANYALQFRDDYDWDKVKPTEEEIFNTTPGFYDEFTTVYVPEEIILRYQTQQDIAYAMLPDDEVWVRVTNGVFQTKPSQPYKEIAHLLPEIKQTMTETITVPVWFWANPGTDDLSKVQSTLTVAVNSEVADIFKHVFADIFADPSQPVFNLRDGGMGTWVLRGVNHDSNKTMSAHSLGTAIDINPSTGSFCIDGTWYGNAYNQPAMPTYLWMQLPETQRKYQVLYVDSPIVRIFKAYGFVWGGDWTVGDAMHFSFLGDGKTARQVGQRNMMEARK